VPALPDGRACFRFSAVSLIDAGAANDPAASRSRQAILYNADLHNRSGVEPASHQPTRIA
jgi:hypothetical protein